MREIGRNIGYSYEHVRKVVAGELTFTKEFNDALCAELGIDADAMWKLAQSLKLKKRFEGADIPVEMPKDDRVRTLWHQMNAVQRAAWLTVGQALVDATEHERQEWQRRLTAMAGQPVRA
jgi:hypothetical protein